MAGVGDPSDWIKAGPYGTKSALAKRCGVTPTEVGRWAQGALPNERHWRTVEEFFGKPKGTIAKLARLSREVSAIAGLTPGLTSRVGKLEREMAAQRKILEDLRAAVRALGSGPRSRR